MICAGLDVGSLWTKAVVLKDYGLIGDEFKQVYDLSLSPLWVKGNQVKYNSEQWRVELVNNNMGKMNGSNHVFVILQKVI